MPVGFFRALGACAVLLSAGCGDPRSETDTSGESLVAAGQEVFRFDTFGDEVFWTDTLRMHEVIQSAVSPKTALAVGFKVDGDAVPPDVLAGADLDDPATTVALLKLNAVVGLQGVVETVDGRDTLVRVGVTCALCHSTVDNSIAPGIGRRLDGWPNRDLDPGRILSLSPALADPAIQAVLTSWGPGKYDAYWNHDNQNNPTVIPPAYGLRDVSLETFSGEGEVSYWNAYVAITQMHGQGDFSDPQLGVSVDAATDLVTSKLPALKAYQLSLSAPGAPAGSFDAAAAARGRAVFEGTGRCAECHTGPALTDANDRLHPPAETGMSPTRAERGTTDRYRTTPLRGAWQHPPYFHDGSAATLADVVEHYDGHLRLGLTAGQKADLVEYLKSL
jgi:mono/diheme cytochrome c family protein